MTQLRLPLACQRWTSRREAWRPAGEAFKPGLHAVAPVDEADAKRFIITHHYSASYPAARFRVGLFRAGVGLAGVAVFSVPMNQNVISSYTSLRPSVGVELGRFVLLDDVEANGETWFLGRAFDLLLKTLPDVRAVLAYADPLPRQAADGRQVTPGHVGTIYQAHNGRYCGRARGETLVLDPEGRVISRRGLSKIRNDERGAAYVYSRLLACGAPKRKALESGADYVTRAIATGPFRRVEHPGNHAYVWPIGTPAARRAALRGFNQAQPYPKRSF